MEITDEIRRQVASEMGKKGGSTTAAKYGHEHFVAIGRKGGAIGGKTSGPRMKLAWELYRQHKAAQDENPT